MYACGMIEAVDFEEGMKDGMRGPHFEEPRFRHHALHVVREDLPARAALVAEAAAKALRLEVVDDHEPTLPQIGAQRRRLAIGHHPPVGLDDVGDGTFEKIGSSSASVLISSVWGPRNVTSLMMRMRFCSASG
jgi:hypothetical protein